MENNKGSMSTVLADKNELINILKENKKAHDEIFNTAVSGYWVEAQEQILSKSKEYDAAIKESQEKFDKFLFSLQSGVDNLNPTPLQYAFNTELNLRGGLNLRYPENHSNDYIRAIRMLEVNTHDKIELSLVEFNQYVLNDWSWKSSFVSNNKRYTDTICGTGIMLSVSGAYGRF